MNRLDVINQVLTCTACDLHEQCTLPVAFRGDPGPIVVVGEAPGEQEDLAGEPFVGPAGKLLAQLLTEADIPPDSVAYVNAVACFPHGPPSWDQMRSCDANKWAQLDYLNPTHVLLLGKVALKSMRPDLDLPRGRARPFLARGRICFSTYHPAAALRNGSYEQTLRDELVVFRQLLDSPDWQAFIPVSCAACAVEAEWWEDTGLGWCRVHLPAAHVAAYEARQAAVAAELDAARRRDAALVQVEQGADPDWMVAAWDALVAYLKHHSEWFADDFWANTTLERPRESRALGPVVLRAAREGLMAKSGQFRKSVASNMTEKPIWTSKIYKAATHGT